MPEPSLSDLEATWQRLNVSVDNHYVGHDGTLQCTQPSPSLEDVGVQAAASGRPSEFEIEDLLGEGGMGRVWVARQAQLGRRVALKKPRPDVKHATTELVREARVTGALEHPNIVPIHALSVDAEGRPSVVMKYLAGEPWSDRLLTTPRTPPEIDRDLEILSQVINGIAFAHAQGVIHRDIKPANVMLGSYGEVVVVDWGLALAYDGEIVEGIRKRDEVTELAGTIAYMAPEMALGMGSQLGPSTDVYLIGATLYEILTGRAPHADAMRSSADVKEALSHIFLKACPDLPHHVPTQLKEIVQKALAFDPINRFQDAKELGNALDAYRRTRDQARLVDEARKRLEMAAAYTDLQDRKVGMWLAQARFGLEEALRMRPEHQEAQELLEHALVVSARREIAGMRVDNALALLDELPTSSSKPGLDVEIHELREKLAVLRMRQEVLERAAAESDLGKASTLRRRFGLAFGACFMAVHVWLGFQFRSGELDHLLYLLCTSSLALVFGLPALIFHRTVLPNAANRRLATALGLTLMGQVGTFVGMWQFGLALGPTFIVGLVQLAFSFGIGAVLLDRRVMWTAPVSVVGAVLGAVSPMVIVELVGLTYFTYFVAGSLLGWDDDHVRLIEDVTRAPPGL